MQTVEAARLGKYDRKLVFHDTTEIAERLEALAFREATSSAALVRSAVRRLLEAADKEVSR
jgi:hypothetical protein